MKTLLFLLPAFVVISVSACTEINNAPQYDSVTWNNRLTCLIKNGKTKSSNCELTLESFVDRKVLSSEEEVESALEEMFSPQSYYATGSLDNVHIGQLKEIILPDSLNNATSVDLKNFIHPGMHLVDMFWNYKGKQIKSVALCDDDLIFDLIATFVTVPLSDSQKNINRTPVLDDSLSVGSFASWSKSDAACNALGEILYSYKIVASAQFDTEGYLTNIYLDADHEAHYGYSCVADIKMTQGELYSTKYMVFCWAYEYGFLTSISVSYNGFGMSISGNGTGETGTKSLTYTDAQQPVDTALVD